MAPPITSGSCETIPTGMPPIRASPTMALRANPPSSSRKEPLSTI